MATVSDILGQGTKRKVPSRWADFHRRLCAERDRLLTLDFESCSSGPPKLDDLSEAATDEAERAISFAAASATQDTIIEVLDAIRRIERGTYGICEITGQPIETARLEAIPWTRYSLEGQSEVERCGNGRRRAIPSLGVLTPPSEGDADRDDDSEAGS